MRMSVISASIVMLSAALPSVVAARQAKPFVDLSYPADALAARVSGAVVVRVTTDPFGKVVEAEALSGPPELRPGAVANAKQWTLAPRERTDAIVFRFDIEQGPCNDDRRSLFRMARYNLAVITACTELGRQPASGGPGDALPIEDYGQGQYPYLAQAGRVFDIVVMDLTIDGTGRVTDVSVLNNAPPLLMTAAVAHVKTWRVVPSAPRRGVVVYEFTEAYEPSCKASDAKFYRVTNDYVRFSACPRPLEVSSSQSSR